MKSCTVLYCRVVTVHTITLFSGHTLLCIMFVLNWHSYTVKCAFYFSQNRKAAEARSLLNTIHSENLYSVSLQFKINLVLHKNQLRTKQVCLDPKSSATLIEWSFHQAAVFYDSFAHTSYFVVLSPPSYFPFLTSIEGFFSAWCWKAYKHNPYNHVPLLWRMADECRDGATIADVFVPPAAWPAGQTLQVMWMWMRSSDLTKIRHKIQNDLFQCKCFVASMVNGVVFMYLGTEYSLYCFSLKLYNMGEITDLCYIHSEK